MRIAVSRTIKILPGVSLGVLLAFLFASSSAAQEPEPGVGNDTCLECHGEPGLNMPLLNGELLSLYIDPDVYASSVHGEGGYACVQCHTNLGEYPHPTFEAQDRRDVNLQLYTACQRCHSGEYELTLDSAHERALEAGIRAAAVCTDCHGAHNTRRLTDPKSGDLLAATRTWVPQTCARCHSTIFEKYLDSVHGSALIEEGNTDVPTCIDCHGVHNIPDPTTAAFRLQSPQLCATCHTDTELMAEYDLSTNVLETYVADFHGTTVTLFEKQSPDAETNKPVCFDCHGVHDIVRTDHPLKGLQVRENLLARCQLCHPDATVEFPDSWLSHYEPSPENHPLVFAVNTFYKFLIPGVLGGMGFIVVLDFGWRTRKRLRQRSEQGATTEQESHPPIAESAAAIEPAVQPADDLDPTRPEAPTEASDGDEGELDESNPTS